MEHLQYPIGKFQLPEKIKATDVKKWIKEIEALPKQIKKLSKNLTDEQLALTYRPNGWTIRQVVHHVFDSHINSYIRFKWTLTEDNPTIKAYYEERWAELEDTKLTPVDISIRALEALHQRWVILLKTLTPEQLQRTYIHPQSGKTFKLEQVIALYAWHGKHHVAHINIALGLS